MFIPARKRNVVGNAISGETVAVSRNGNAGPTIFPLSRGLTISQAMHARSNTNRYANAHNAALHARDGSCILISRKDRGEREKERRGELCLKKLTYSVKGSYPVVRWISFPPFSRFAIMRLFNSHNCGKRHDDEGIAADERQCRTAIRKFFSLARNNFPASIIIMDSRLKIVAKISRAHTATNKNVFYEKSRHAQN